MFLTKLRAFLRLFGSTGIPFLLLAILLWGLKEGWGWVSLEMQFLGYKGSVAALGPDPRLPVVGTTFPPSLVLATAILGQSPLLLQTILGSLVLGWVWRQSRRLPAEVMLLSSNESTYIPPCTKHRLENPGTTPLVVIEVQNGEYLGEDDIVRFEDDYDRQ